MRRTLYDRWDVHVPAVSCYRTKMNRTMVRAIRYVLGVPPSFVLSLKRCHSGAVETDRLCRLDGFGGPSYTIPYHVLKQRLTPRRRTIIFRS